MSKIKTYPLPLFLLVLLSCTAASGQSYTDGLLSHKITVHYPDHLVIATVKPTGADVFPQSEKTYSWFSGGQINTTQGGFSGKLLHGDYQDFYLNKNLKESGSFDKGLKNGNWKNWTNQGILISEYTFKQGQKNGDYAKYDLLGKRIERGAYHNDLLSGKQETQVADSTIIKVYKDGKLKDKKSGMPKIFYKIFPKKSAQQAKP